MPGWKLFPRTTEPPSETAQYTITFAEFHPCVRPDRRPSKSTTVRGHAAYKATAEAVRHSGGTVLRVVQRGR